MEKIYRILLGIFLVCLIPILLVLSYWSCRYSYYGTVDYSIRNLPHKQGQMSAGK